VSDAEVVSLHVVDANGDSDHAGIVPPDSVSLCSGENRHVMEGRLPRMQPVRSLHGRSGVHGAVKSAPDIQHADRDAKACGPSRSRTYAPCRALYVLSAALSGTTR
jgi:hypothetical protein